MKHKSFYAITCFVLVIVYLACEKEGFIFEDDSLENKIPLIETISYDDANDVFTNLKTLYNLDKHRTSPFSHNIQGMSTTDTLGLIIETDIIKQVTLGDYTSYTMKIVDQDSVVFYNLTIEYKNGISDMFITKYTPTEYWLNNKNELYQGEVQSRRVDLTQYTDPEEAFEEEIIGPDPGLGSSPGGSNAVYGPNYPWDCMGTVIVTTELVPYQCSCEDHWPWQNCTCPSVGGTAPGYDQITLYSCEESWDFIPDDPDNTTNPEGGSPDPIPDNPKITATITPEECTERINGDINGDCSLDAYELCRLQGYNHEVCECEAAGGTLEDCIFEENISINLLTDECANYMIANNLLGITDESVYTIFLNEIRTIFFEDNDVTLVFRNDEDVPDYANASTDFDTQSEIDSGTYNIIITLSDTYLNNNPTKLSIALTLIHEMVHAKLMYAYLHGTLLTEYPEYIDLQNSFDAFIEDRTDENGQAMNDASHIVMVDFISDMAYALFKYAEEVGMDNITQQYCNDITKGSFYNTPAIDLIDTGENTPEELNNMNVNEQDNNENALGDDC